MGQRYALSVQMVNILTARNFRRTMMHCTICDKMLNDYESTRKTLDGKYLDMCQDCYTGLDVLIPTIDRKDLLHEADMPTMDQIFDEYGDYVDFNDNEEL
jgi:hypothetical protein